MPRKKKYIRQPLPPARLGCEPDKRKYIIKRPELSGHAWIY